MYKIIFALVLFGVISSNALPRQGPILIKPDPSLEDEVHEYHPIPNLDDMILTEDQKRSGLIDERYRWRNGMYFYIDPSFSQNEYNTILGGLNGLAGATCVLLYLWNSNPSGDYVHIMRGGPGSGCSAAVGRIGGRQTMNLDWTNCIYYDVVLHEAIHSYGFWHEHQRPDRDNSVIIHNQNIIPGTTHNFNIMSNTSPFNVPYDYRSLMHYPANAFSSNGQNTISARNGSPIGPTGDLTTNDRTKLIRMYNC